MILQHNLSALNALRNNGINNAQTNSNLEKLSSGYRINRAADDAAGLAISEKMRSQIRGLGMAEQNTSNAIDLIQTAEGGLNEVHDILHRMRELAVQAANGTYVDEDRAQINLELDALKSEVNRIASSTHFNGISLLDGTLGGRTVSAMPGTVADGAALGSLDYYPGTYPALTNYLNDLGFSCKVSNAGTPGQGVNLNGYVALHSFDPSILGETANLIVTSGTVTGDEARLSLQIGDDIYHSIISDGLGVAPNTNLENEYVFVDSQGNVMAVLINTNNTSVTPPSLLSKTAESGIINGIVLTEAPVSNSTILSPSTSASGASYLPDYLQNIVVASDSNELVFQIGANGTADQQVGLRVPLMSTANLGNYVATANNPTGTLAGISVLTRERANEAIDVIDAAVQQTSAVRASLGALQNRMEHTLNNLGITKENLTAAESTIRDVDMAKEMMEFTKNSILVQASQAMLAQANQLPQGILSLLS